jgi:uroporphyrinogen decarboxylase
MLTTLSYNDKVLIIKKTPESEIPMPSNPSFLRNGKTLIFDVLNHEKTSAIPWVPFSGVHVGKLKNYAADTVLQDGEKLLESLLEANRLYAPDGQPVVFDLQIEAEILGCNLLWVHNSPPTVVDHPLQSNPAIPEKMPTPEDGRLPIILDVMRRMKTAVGEHTALYGLITGPFTLAAHLRGTDIFMDMVDQPDYVIELLDYCRRFVQQIASFYIDAGMDVIAVVDPMISQISPRHFKRFMTDPFTTLFDSIRAQEHFSAFFVCGDATKNIENMCLTKPDCIAVDENINMATAQLITQQYNITLQGNIPLTTRMLLGQQEDNMQYVLELMDTLDHHNLIISPGCDMPYDTPVENVIAVAEAIRNPEQTRLVLENYKAKDVDLSSVILPDYKNLEKPLMEVFTLDSSACAACAYMLAAAERAAEALSGQVDMVEYKITKAENIARLMKMEVKNLPSILINGELKFSSLIPPQQELIETLQRYLKK